MLIFPWRIRFELRGEKFGEADALIYRSIFGRYNSNEAVLTRAMLSQTVVRGGIPVSILRAETLRWTAPSPNEYAAGFRARLADIPISDAAHPNWQSGWIDADTELLESARHRRVLEEGGEDDYPAARALLFDTGRNARLNGLPFNTTRTEPWKQGCILAEITVGDEFALQP